MKLYDFPLSPNCRKVRAVAYELGIDLEYHRVNLVTGESRQPAFLAKNPNGRVPVLEDDGFLLWESNAIISYLASRHGSDRALIPSDARERAEVDRWLSWQLAHLGPAMSKVAFELIVKKLTGQGEPDRAQIEVGTAEFHKFTRALETSLGHKEHIAGRLSVADFALAAHYSVAPMCGLDVKPYPRVDAWLARVLSRNSMKRALADAQAMLS